MPALSLDTEHAILLLGFVGTMLFQQNDRFAYLVLVLEIRSPPPRPANLKLSYSSLTPAYGAPQVCLLPSSLQSRDYFRVDKPDTSHMDKVFLVCLGED